MGLLSALERRLAGRILAGRSDLGAGAASAQETPGPEGWRIEGRVLDRVGPGGEDRGIACLSRCTLDGARVEDTVVGAMEACLARRASFRRTSLDRVALCDLSGAVLEGVRVGEVTASSLCGARCTDTSLDRLVLVDLSGARLVRVRIREALGADLQGAVLEDCEIEGRPVSAGPAARGPGHVASRVALALAAALVVLALVAVLRPPPPPPPERSEPATSAQVQAAQHGLARLREALARAHETMVRNGASEAAWPSLEDVTGNRYDVDGDGPEEVRATLVPGGLPDNPLTGSRGGVLPWCDEGADQETLSGTDADWHYCDGTGRVHASAGWSGQPTATW